MSSPHGSTLFLLTAVEHSVCEETTSYFSILVDGYSGSFQFFGITDHALIMMMEIMSQQWNNLTSIQSQSKVKILSGGGIFEE